MAPSPSSSMDGIAMIRHYVDRIIHGDGKCHGMKVLLLDAATTQIVSAVYSQTEILNNQVYLVSSIMDAADNNGESFSYGGSGNKSTSHLNAVVFIRPTPASIEAVSAELKQPRFAEYHIFVSAILPTGLLRTLAAADVYHERVQQVQEMYADFLPMNSDLWTLQQQTSLQMTVAAGTSWAPKHAACYERNLQGLQNMLLALKKQPLSIRYAAHSPCAEELAKDLQDAIHQDDIFHFHSKEKLHVLVLDRRDDPVTPLLSQWTYQAMVHELLGINNHRVLLKGAPGVSKDLEEVVLSSTQDDFFRDNRFKNFGQLGEEIQRLLQEYQKQTQYATKDAFSTIEEMQAFMDRFPELRSKSHVVSKHVAIMGELARLVEICSLMDVSQLEQQLACNDDLQGQWREVLEKLQSPQIKIPDKLRLGLLYALRYELSGNIHMLQSAMSKGGVPADMVNLVPVMLRYAGRQSRGPGLFGDNHLVAKMTKSILTSVQGVQNVYAQHVPAVMDTLQALVKGKLSYKTHPSVSITGGSSASIASSLSSGSQQQQQYYNTIPDQVLIFMVGGVTYEEGTKIYEFNQQQQQQHGTAGVKVVLAGSTIHNSTSFLDELRLTAV